MEFDWKTILFCVAIAAGFIVVVVDAVSATKNRK